MKIIKGDINMFEGSFELNNARRDIDYSTGRIKPTSPLVEVFSYLAAGKDIAPLNGKLKDSNGRVISNVDSVVKHIISKAYEAGGGNAYAATELNEIRKFVIQPLLQEELKLLTWMGNYKNIGFNDSIVVETKKLNNAQGRFQALNGDVLFPAWTYDDYPVTTTTISGGYEVDYRKLQFGDLTDENIGMEQVRTDIRNKSARYVIFTIWNAISNTANVRFLAQGSGISKAALDEISRNVRRFGNVSIFGDFSVVSQLNGFLGYEGVTPVTGGISQAAMDEIRKSGLIGMYNGAVVKEIQNEFNLTKPLPTGDGFELYFPAGLLFVVPAGMQSPVRTWTRGGLTSVQGIDVATGRNLVRFDLEVAADLEKGSEFKIGIVLDEDYGNIEDPRNN